MRMFHTAAQAMAALKAFHCEEMAGRKTLVPQGPQSDAY